MGGSIERIFFRPPLAVARVGGSDTPLESFVWSSDRSIHGAHRTIVTPAVSLAVMADGSLRPYRPGAIQFRDHGLLRPVAPFFELWVRWSPDGSEEPREEPLTAGLLRREWGIGPAHVEFVVTVANRKAQRRTGLASCAFIAHEQVAGNDHERRPLLACSPHQYGQAPLVSAERPIPLGHFQVMRPMPGKAMDVDLDVLRVRFTPARGEVYGPPAVNVGPASPLQQGLRLPPSTLGGRLHEIVPARNRILNADAGWAGHKMNVTQDEPQPTDSFDGVNVGDDLAWGVVDDTCDGVIEARLVHRGVRHVAQSRVVSSCPDWAPDRRPFYSIADDLADRDRGVEAEPLADVEQLKFVVADLFERAFETASLINLDALRARALDENDRRGRSAEDAPPRTDGQSMTGADRGARPDQPALFADLTAAMFPAEPSEPPPASPSPPPRPPERGRLPYAQAARFAHESLCDLGSLLAFLGGEDERVKALVRPPVGNFAELARHMPAEAAAFRDPRTARDRLHDMRMPPYMRDSDAMPLALTRRQYAMLMQLVKRLDEERRNGGESDGR